MSIGYGFARQPSVAAHARESELICVGILFAAIFFNFALAIINRNIKPLSPMEVILAEMAIIAAAHAVCMLRFRDIMAPWYLLLWLMLMIALGRWLWLADIEPKSLRDVIIIPTFICLGIAAGRRNLNATILLLQCLVLAAMLIEAILPQAFGSFVGIKSYYINTRGFEDTRFWNTGSEYFVSATRSGERFVGGDLGIYRLSSIFLEPVSLGNYCIAITAFACARFKSLTRAQLIFLAASNIVLLVGCDGRLAVATSALILAMTFALGAPRRVSALFLPATLGSAFVLYYGLGYRPGSDNLTGRIAFTVDRLSSYSLSELFGVSSVQLAGTADSGIAYMILTQSLLGFFALAAVLFLASLEENYQQTSYKNSVMLYVSLTMIVSNSFLSIKTAGLFWYVLGALQCSRPALAGVQRARRDREPVG